jgi:hypothetical protein
VPEVSNNAKTGFSAACGIFSRPKPVCPAENRHPLRMGPRPRQKELQALEKALETGKLPSPGAGPDDR